jgi:hypothetical protein
MLSSEEHRYTMTARFCALPLFGMAFCALLISCNSEVVVKNKAMLTGRWELYKALRNQKATETLDGTYFTFSDAGKMATNLPVGPEGECDFELSANQIKQKSAKPLTYNIVELSDSTLTLSIELRGMPFELFMHRAAEVAPAVQDSMQVDSVTQ